MSDKIHPVSLKPPTTFAQQVQILRDRNLVIDDNDFAVDFLSRVNYYRLSGYWLTLRDAPDHFREGSSFSHVVRLYEFDTKLRHLLSGLLDCIEISARTHIAYHMAHNFGPLSYMDESLFISRETHADFMKKLQDSIENARKGQELFVEHHDTKYQGQFPIWAMVELLSFGSLSKFFGNLKRPIQKDIANHYYGVPPLYLRSWWRTLSHTRNICAHHGRLYNKRLTLSPELFPDDKTRMGNSRIFAVIFVCGIICPSDQEWLTFETSLEALMDEYEDVVELRRVGFPPDWRRLLRDTVHTRRFVVNGLRMKARSRNYPHLFF